MSLTRKIAHNTIVQAAGKIVGTVLGLLSISLITRYLGQEGFGQYTTIMTFLQFFGILVDFGLTLVTVQMISEPGADEPKVLSNIFTLRLVSAIIFLGLAPIAVLFFPYDPLIKKGVVVTVASFLFIALNQVMTGVFQRHLSMNRVAITEVLNRLVLLGLIWLTVAKDYGLLMVMLAVVISNAIQFILLYHFSQKFVSLKLSFDKGIWRRIFHLSWPMAITISLNLIYLKTDTIILSLVRSQAEVGIYGATYKVLEVLVTLPMMFAGLVLPVLTQAWSRQDLTRFRHVFQRAFDALSMLAIPLVIGTWMTSREVMVLVAGEPFAVSGQILNILILAAAVIFVGSLFGHAIVAINRQKNTIWAYGASALVSVIGYLIFIPTYSYFGAAWMTVFSEAFVTLGIIYVFWRTTKYFPNVAVWAKSLFSSVLMAGAIWLLGAYARTPSLGINLLLAITIGSATYFLAMILVRGLSRDMVKEIVRLK